MTLGVLPGTRDLEPSCRMVCERDHYDLWRPNHLVTASSFLNVARRVEGGRLMHETAPDRQGRFCVFQRPGTPLFAAVAYASLVGATTGYQVLVLADSYSSYDNYCFEPKAFGDMSVESLPQPRKDNIRDAMDHVGVGSLGSWMGWLPEHLQVDLRIRIGEMAFRAIEHYDQCQPLSPVSAC